MAAPSASRALWPRALALLGLALAACGPASPAARDSRPLRVALYHAPLSADPHLHAEYLSYSVAQNTYEGLTSLDGLLRVRPALAESWQSVDENTWLFRLREGVRFHDGRPLRVADVVYSLQRAQAPGTNGYRSYLVGVKQVRALDEQTLEIVCARPNVVLLTKLAFVLIVPSGAPVIIKEPIGTGPYRARHLDGHDRVELRAFEDYWGEAPKQARVDLLAIADGTERARAFQAGEVDVALDLPPERAESLQSAPGGRVVAQPGLTMSYLLLNHRRPPFADPRVRQALDLALDREALVARELRGFGRPAHQLVSRSVFGFAAGVDPGTRNLVQARALLRQAGYPGGLDVELEHMAGRRTDELRRQLAEAGLRVTAQPRPMLALAQRISRSETQLSLHWLAFSSGDASEVLDSMVHTPDPELGFGGDNLAGYSNREVDRLIEESAQSADMRLRRELLAQAMHLTMTDLDFVPLVVPDDLLGLRDQVAWQPRSDGRVLGIDLSRTAK